MLSTIYLWSVLALLLSPVYSMHFYLESDKEQCFYQDLASTAVLAAHHEAWEFEPTSNNWIRPESLSVQITIEEVFDNNHRVLNQKLNAKGDFIFTATDSGEHKICYRALSGGWFHKSKVKIDIDFETGDGAHVDSRAEHKVSDLKGRVRELNDKMHQIRIQQQSLREREAAFRDQSEATNARVIRWTMIQLFCLGITCAWQLNHLRGYFMKQKLV